MIITGNVQVSPTHLTLGRDVTLPVTLTEETLKPYKNLADILHGRSVDVDGVHYPAMPNHPLAIMQLSHAGRQSPNLLGGRRLFASPLAPSPIGLGSGLNSKGEDNILSKLCYRFLFQTPREMTSVDIDDVVAQFVKGTEVAAKAGYDGVQLHVAHGCEFTQITDRNPKITFQRIQIFWHSLFRQRLASHFSRGESHYTHPITDEP